MTTKGSLTNMLNDYGRRPVPSPSEELHWAGLVRRWMDHPSGADNAPPGVRRAGLRARNRLVEGNVRWVVAMAKKHCRGGHEEERLMESIQWGVLGLVRAIERFDPSRGYKLSTFSYFWILQAMQRGDETRNLVRIPDNVLLETRKITKAASDLQRAGVNPTAERVETVTGIPARRVHNRIESSALMTIHSLDSVSPGSEDVTLMDVIPASGPEAIADDLELELLKDWMDANLHLLSSRQRQVLGLVRRGTSRKEIAEQLQLSTSAVGSHQKHAVQKLQSAFVQGQELTAA